MTKEQSKDKQVQYWRQFETQHHHLKRNLEVMKRECATKEDLLVTEVGSLKAQVRNYEIELETLKSMHLQDKDSLLQKSIEFQEP
eukprot:CAMPEP_0201283280 /NCGR_PEP_ID=MMETSP1317-20130820/8135_1 /ASSEMBLY_ACC=CAM_ASM_000770 /TAXON_ID=187299 /ORGANISM="Undescribed Undescribed, Strain Undescribed" /LENGTH=84 /DNA_ID=CAMNT_0047598991 /DNA_START=468 /DNA_END=719 /DNA_ORIENTATION=+